MNNKRQIVNIVNFIRGFDSEPQPKLETYYTVKNQIELIEKYGFKATFLIQYDALQMDHFRELMLSLPKDRYEIGVWFEIIKPLAEDADVKWNCRREWSGKCNCGYAMAYDLDVRMKMIDLVFEQFKGIFGYYPRVFGAWFYDTFTARYICDKYGLDAFCNCKEQYGTDGYTLWGGYYGQAYYPSRTNVFIPAQSKEEQMNIPLFKMLGSDQVYQYEFGRRKDMRPKESQSVITLEPVYHKSGGGLPKWVDWYMKENFNGECLSFGYAQAGQENSFGWKRMKDGLIYQFALFDKLQKEGKIEIEQLGETGRWYKEQYETTPASAITAHSAYDDEGKDTVWYCSKYFRISLHGENGNMYIRDLHIFDESIPDPFEHENCKETFAVYESLPVVDGFIFSGNGVKSGAYFNDSNGKKLTYKNMTFTETKDNECEVKFDDTLKAILYENSVEFTAKEDFTLTNIISNQKTLKVKIHEAIRKTNFRNMNFVPNVISQDSNKIVLEYKNKKYAVVLELGKFSDSTTVKSENGKIKAKFSKIP